jgi:P27 family predicted phage terminase small subunit
MYRDAGRQLLTLGVMTRLDGPTLAAYCQCYKRWCQAEAAIEEKGATITLTKVDSKGNVTTLEQRNPAIGIAIEMMRQMRAFAGELGVTPASRPKIHATPQPRRAAQHTPLQEPKSALGTLLDANVNANKPN